MTLRALLPVVALLAALAAPLHAQPRRNDSLRVEVAPPADVRPVPAFAVISLDDSTRAITAAMLAGRVYLVDFWATWCPPCVEELPTLTRLYKEFSPAGFEILGISLDQSDERIRAFRAKRFAMPWLHTRAPGGFSDVLLKMFDVQNIPDAVLVDRDGHIIAGGEELRDGGLERRLRELFPRKSD